MKNKLFRNAFWAMCMGFTIPMTLFVVAKLRSGQAPLGMAVADNGPRAGSLRGQWNQESSKRQSIGPSLSRARSAKSPSRRRDLLADADLAAQGAQLGAGIETDPETDSRVSSSTVRFDHELETDPEEGEEKRGPHPVRPKSSPGRQPRAVINPDEVLASQTEKTARIESQLDEILGRLDRLVVSAADRPVPVPTDRLQQATDLLQLLKQAHELQTQAEQIPEITAAKPRPQATKQTTSRTKPAPTTPARQADSPKSTIAAAAETQPRGKPAQNGSPSLPAAPGRENSAGPSLTTAKAPPRRAPDREPASKVFRPQFIKAKDLAALVTPMLTPGVGRIGAAGADAEGSSSGWQESSAEAILVHDTPLVLRKVDRLLQELDQPPERVVLTATVLSVWLSPVMSNGVDLAEVGSRNSALAVRTVELTHGQSGLKAGVLYGETRDFVQALEAVAQVRRSHTAQSTVTSRQTTQVPVVTDGLRTPGGPELKVRPVATRDGTIYLEVESQAGDSLSHVDRPRDPSIASPLVLRPGESAVFGGFISEQLRTHSQGTHGLDDVPLIGNLMRRDTNEVQRLETIVVLTPQIEGRQATTPPPPVSPSSMNVPPRTMPQPLLSENSTAPRELAAARRPLDERKVNARPDARPDASPARGAGQTGTDSPLAFLGKLLPKKAAAPPVAKSSVAKSSATRPSPAARRIARTETDAARKMLGHSQPHKIAKPAPPDAATLAQRPANRAPQATGRTEADAAKKMLGQTAPPQPVARPAQAVASQLPASAPATAQLPPFRQIDTARARTRDEQQLAEDLRKRSESLRAMHARPDRQSAATSLSQPAPGSNRSEIVHASGSVEPVPLPPAGSILIEATTGDEPVIQPAAAVAVPTSNTAGAAIPSLQP